MGNPLFAQVEVGVFPFLTLLVFLASSVWLGTIAQKAIERGSFLKSYFLGNRGLGVWTLALTATVQSGGTFVGFPSLVYSHGWVVAVWIAGYMVVPIAGFAFYGKRLAQLSRKLDAVTAPELLERRFNSAAVGVVGTLFVLLFMMVMTVAQFKAGALIVKSTWPGATIGLAPTTAPEEPAGDSPERPDPAKKAAPSPIDRKYLLALGVFGLTVIGYTMIGGFLAAVWTDLFQSVLMFVGVMLLLPLTLMMVDDAAIARNYDPATVRETPAIELATQLAVERTGPDYATIQGYSPEGRTFLPLGLAVSFFAFWVFGGVGAPAGVSRVVASRDSAAIRRSIVVLSIYNLFIYLPLVVVAVCAKAILDPSQVASDEIIPRMAHVATTGKQGGPLLAGLILTAPFGAVMSTVSSYLVVIGSAMVRDVYQRLLRPRATERETRYVTYGVMATVGLLAMAAAIRPPEYLQALVVLSGSGAGATFLVPLIMAAYWRRGTPQGCVAAMLGGAATLLLLYAVGWEQASRSVDQGYGVAALRPYFLLQLDPFLWGVAVSAALGIVVSLLTPAPDARRVAWLFDEGAPAPPQPLPEEGAPQN